MDENKKIIDALTDELIYHSKLYYDDDAPKISDFEYDAKLRKLEGLERLYPQFRRADSPTGIVGGKSSAAFTKVRHDVKMESLQNAFSFDEIEDFVRRVRESAPNATFTVEPKIDGLSVSLLYEDGVLTIGSTRGDGTTGENITDNLLAVHTIPPQIPSLAGVLEVRGEVYMPKGVFLDIVAKQVENGEMPFKNPRNAAAGSLRQKDSSITRSRGLDIFMFNIQRSSDSFSTHKQSIDYLKDLGLPVIPSCVVCADAGEIRAQIERIGNERASLPFDIDGAVVKLNELSLRASLGSTDKFPRWAVAFKYPPEIKSTKLIDIEVAVGRTGAVTPTAVFEPVQLAGSTVARAVLHNQDFIDELGLRIGDTIEVSKAGDVIPEVLRSVAHEAGSAPYIMPERCPSCAEGLVHLDGEVALRCINPECPEQLRRNIINFVSRDAMDIEGMGEAIIDKLIEGGHIREAADIYYLSDESLLALDKIKDKSARNLREAIETSRSRGLARVILALGIRNVGKKTAALIARRFGNIYAIIAASQEEISAIDGVGPIIASSVRVYFDDKKSIELVEKLNSAGVKLTEDTASSTDKLSGLTFVVTGTLEGMSRDEAHALIEANGGKTSSSVSKKTSYLIAGENGGSKLQKAAELSVKVLSQQEFLEMIEG